MPIQAVIFDLDGTLVDSLADIANATNHALQSAGYPTHPLDSYRQFVGGGSRKLIERALPEEGLTTVDAVHQKFAIYYVEHLLVETAPYPEVIELLTNLQARHIPMAILSNKPHMMVVDMAKHFFSDFSFVGIHGQKPDVPKKPDPSSVLSLAQEMNLAPSEIAYIGDSDVDIDTAHAAGMLSVGVAWGFRGKKELEERNAAVILDSPLELQTKIPELA